METYSVDKDLSSAAEDPEPLLSGALQKHPKCGGGGSKKHRTECGAAGAWSAAPRACTTAVRPPRASSVRSGQAAGEVRGRCTDASSDGAPKPGQATFLPTCSEQSDCWVFGH